MSDLKLAGGLRSAPKIKGVGSGDLKGLATLYDVVGSVKGHF